MFKQSLIILGLLILFAARGFAQVPERYVKSLFELDTLAINLNYGTAPALTSPYNGENSTQPFVLNMDIYGPKDDTLRLHPVLIVAHGGGFIEGEKEHDDMLAFCDTFARKGYYTATIQYRQGMNPSSEISATRAVYRGLQDCRAAIRFIRNSAEEGIDTNRVYFLGSSAGGFMALHNLYMNEESERPAATYETSGVPPLYLDAGPDLGRLDATGNAYEHNAHPNAIISLWGALGNTGLIKDGDPHSPVFLIHGTADDYVYFNVGHPFGISTIPETYGSNPISQKLDEMGIEHETYFVGGEGHEFYGVTNGMWNDDGPNAYWDTVITKVTQFLYKQHKPTADFDETIDNKTVSFRDNSVGASKWYWDFGDNTTSNEQNPVHTYGTYGRYRVSFAVQNEIDSWDTLSQIIEIKSPSMKDSLALVALYNNTDGDSWAQNINWLSSDSSFSTWFGVNEIGGRVRGINLFNNGLAGTIPKELSELDNIQYLYLSDNPKLNGKVPLELGKLGNLQYFYLHNDNLSELPDFKGSALDSSLLKLKVEGNRLDFGDIEPNIGIADIFTYSPQDSVGSLIDTIVVSGSEFNMSVSVGGTANKYQWMKDNIDIEGAVDAEYNLSSVSLADSGFYVCRITNTIATELTLYSRAIKLNVRVGTDINDRDLTSPPKNYVLKQNYPNPFNPTTTIAYALPRESDVQITIYNMLGEQIAELVNGYKPAGRYRVSFDAARFASGVYYYKIKAGSFSAIKKMLLIK